MPYQNHGDLGDSYFGFIGINTRAYGCFQELGYSSLPSRTRPLWDFGEPYDFAAADRNTGFITGNNPNHDGHQGETNSAAAQRPGPEERDRNGTSRVRSPSRTRRSGTTPDLANSDPPVSSPSTHHPGIQDLIGMFQPFRSVTPVTSDGGSASVHARHRRLFPLSSTNRGRITQSQRVRHPFLSSPPEVSNNQSTSPTTQEDADSGRTGIDSANPDVESAQGQLQRLVMLDSEEEQEATTRPDNQHLRQAFPGDAGLINFDNRVSNLNRIRVAPEPAPLAEAAQGDEDPFCTICQEDVKRSEMKTTLNGCGHQFHVDCIYHWVTEQDNCPNCRAWVVIT